MLAVEGHSIDVVDGSIKHKPVKAENLNTNSLKKRQSKKATAAIAENERYVKNRQLAKKNREIQADPTNQ